MEITAAAAPNASSVNPRNTIISAIRRRLPLLSLAPIVFLAACSGGGGGGASSLPTTTTATKIATAPTNAPVATTTTTTTTTTTSANPTSVAGGGTVVDLPYDGTSANPGFSVLSSGAAARPGAAIAGATVFVGPQILMSATPPSSTPSGYVSAVTDANGVFHLANAPTGNETITIYAPAPHITVLHADLAMATSASPAGTFYMTIPTATESSWLSQENANRATFGVAPTTLDEAVVEAARYWSTFMATNHYFAHCVPATACGDAATSLPASYGPQDVDPAHRFYFEHGFSGASEGENIADNFSSWQNANSAFMAEQNACPNGQPSNCTYTSSTGHFLNIVNSQYAWTGFGISNSSTSYYDQEFAVVYTTSPHLSSTQSQMIMAPGLSGSN